MKSVAHSTGGLLLTGLFALGGCASGSSMPVPAAASAAPAPFPTTPPPPLAERPLDFPPYVESTLPNGMSLIVIEHPSQPLADVTLYVNGGSSGDPVERAGLADLTAEMLTKGTEARTATEISEAIERVGGGLSSSAGADWVSISANVLAEHLPLAMELVAESATEPTFPEDELELARRRALSSLQSAMGQSSAIASWIFARAIYGEQHPYGFHAEPGSVSAVTRQEIVDYYNRFFKANNAMLVVAGDVDATEVRRLAVDAFGGWEVERIPFVSFPGVPQPPATEILLVNRPGSAQTNIVIGNPGFEPTSPDYFPLLVLNGVLGGTPDARLFRVLREEKGWTYGSYSRFTRPREVGYFSATAEVRPEVTDSAVSEMLHQIRQIRDEAVPAEELESTKGFLAGSFPLRIETAGQISRQVATTRLLGVPTTYMTEYRERIQAVTAADVQRVARQYLDPDHTVIVVVGDASDLMPRLEAIAPVRLYDVEGNPLDEADL